MSKITAVLGPQESIIWRGVISRQILFLKLIISSIGIVVVASLFFLTDTTAGFNLGNIPNFIKSDTLGIIVLAFGLLFSLIIFLSDFVRVYMITNKRILIRSGIIGTDFISIYFTQVRSANVRVDLIDKIFSMGTISIDTGKIETSKTGSGENERTNTRTLYDKFIHIEKPYEVYRYLQSSLTGREESLYSGRADKETLNS